MTQRNPMNDRNNSEEHKGSTRKSAASAKPKSRAASSVYVQSTTKTPQQKKAAKKADRQKQNELDRKYYNPPTARYKMLRKLWWGTLVGAIVFTAASWLGRDHLPEVATYICLGLGYACIIAALYIDLSKIRKERRAYEAEMEAKKSKSQRAAEKKQKAAGKQKADEEAPAEEPKKGLMGGLFGKKKETGEQSGKDEPNRAYEGGKASAEAAKSNVQDKSSQAK